MPTRSDELLGIYETVVGRLDEGKDVKEIADEIEQLAGWVTKEDAKKFDSLLKKYLDPVDPKEEMTIGDAAEKLGEKGAKALLKELEALSYNDPEEEEDSEEEE